MSHVDLFLFPFQVKFVDLPFDFSLGYICTWIYPLTSYYLQSMHFSRLDNDLWIFVYVFSFLYFHSISQFLHMWICLLTSIYFPFQHVQVRFVDLSLFLFRFSKFHLWIYPLTSVYFLFQVRFVDAIEAFTLLIDQIYGGMKSLEQKSKNATTEDFQLLLQLSLHVIHLASRLELNDSQLFEFKKQVHRLVTFDPRGQDGESLLHLSVDPKISLTSEEFFSPFPSLAVVQLLIECGAQINAVDKKKNTPLHNSIKFLTYSELQNEGILGCLLQNGAHVDMYNSEGQSALKLIQSQGLPVFPLQHQTLRCLASEIIMKYKIPYNDVPISLLQFIQMHG